MNLCLLQHQTPPVAPNVLHRSSLEAVFKGVPRRICYHALDTTLRWRHRTQTCEVRTIPPLVVGCPQKTHWGQKQTSVVQKLFIGHQTLGNSRGWRRRFLVSESSVIRFVLFDSWFGFYWGKYSLIKYRWWVHFVNFSFKLFYKSLQMFWRVHLLTNIVLKFFKAVYQLLRKHRWFVVGSWSRHVASFKNVLNHRGSQAGKVLLVSSIFYVLVFHFLEGF